MGTVWYTQFVNARFLAGVLTGHLIPGWWGHHPGIGHRDYATQFNFSIAPSTMNIYITNWGIQAGLASTPLFHKRFLTDLPLSFVNTYLVQLAVYHVNGGFGALLTIFARLNVDMAIDYHTNGNFSSDFIKETVYHEMSHASHYTKVGTGWYTQFVNAELAETAAHPSGALNPYGDGTTSNAPIIALGEGWAYHMGHFLANQRYGLQSSDAAWQGTNFQNNNPINGLSSHLNLLENFDPNLVTDPFRWIPLGLMEDLIDLRNETNPITDNVSSTALGQFTIAQLFNALQSDVTTVPQYRIRFIQQNSGNQSTAITNLFGQYHY